MRVPNNHRCSSRPRLPSGFSRLCSGPAPKPSSEIEKPATRTLVMTTFPSEFGAVFGIPGLFAPDQTTTRCAATQLHSAPHHLDQGSELIPVEAAYPHKVLLSFRSRQ